MADEPTPPPSVDEERLRRLLESPLDAPSREPGTRRRPDPDTRPTPRSPRHPQPSGQVSAWLPLVAAVLVGGLVAIVAYVVAEGGGEDPVATPTTVTTQPAPPPVETEHPFGALPDGYVPLNERVGARPERILARDDALFVSFTTAVRSTLDPDETAGFTKGQWTAVLDDGRRIAAIGEFTDPFARGTFTLGFPVDGYEPDDVASVELTAEAIRSGLSEEMTIPIEDGLPWSGVPSGDRIPLEGGLVFVIDGIDLETETGRIDWHFEGADELEGAATASLRFTAEGTFPGGFMFESHADTFLNTFGSATPPQAVSRAGTIELTAERVNRPSTIRTIHATWIVDWFSLIPAEATIPLDGVPLVTVG